MKNIINYVILFILLFIVIYQHNNPRIKTNEIIKTDTIEIPKTIIIEKLKPDTIYLTKYITDTLYINDSIKVKVNIPISTYEYNDSLHYIKYNGYKAHIEHFECKAKETIIYKEKVSEIKGKQPLIEFKPSIGVGYGLKHQKVDMYIGGSIVFNIK